MDAEVNGWFNEELAGSTFADEWLGKRLSQLVEKLDGAMGASISLACQDRANTKAAYRFFFANHRVRCTFVKITSVVQDAPVSFIGKRCRSHSPIWAPAPSRPGASSLRSACP